MNNLEPTTRNMQILFHEQGVKTCGGNGYLKVY